MTTTSSSYTGLRGLTLITVHLRTGRGEAHSGLYGGAALNAAHALVETLSAVLPRDGAASEPLAVGLVEPSEEEVEAWELLTAGEEALRDAGLVPADHDAAREFHRRTLALASLDVHGLRCGPSDMDQAIVPATATATLSVRLAPGQRVEVVTEALERLLAEAAPTGAEIAVERKGTADPALFDPRDPVLDRAAQAMEEATGWRPVPARIGGSIPSAVLSPRGIPTVLSGFYMPEDAIHAPNERIRREPPHARHARRRGDHRLPRLNLTTATPPQHISPTRERTAMSYSIAISPSMRARTGSARRL